MYIPNKIYENGYNKLYNFFDLSHFWELFEVLVIGPFD